MKKAVISVFDKRGVVEFARGLVELGFELISTGGTYSRLQESGLPVTYVSDVTGFPEVLGGRVKTLHPRIHAGILAKETPEHRREMTEIGAQLIDLVVVNLYPFEQVSRNPKSTLDDVLENIDIGGPTLLRAAAKNFPRVTAVCDPDDYGHVLQKLSLGKVPEDLRRKLAAKAFAHTAYYDTLIGDFLGQGQFPVSRTIALRKVQDLRYGENPHQKAAFYQDGSTSEGIALAEQLHGKELSFNNIFDADAAWRMVSEFSEPCAVAVKHTNPCGLAIGASAQEAFRKAFEADPVSIFGGIVAFNCTVDQATALLMKKIFLEIVIAPEFTSGALEVLTRKPNLRLLRLAPEGTAGLDWKRVSGGFLVQQGDIVDLVEDQLQVVTKKVPSAEEMSDLRFAWKVVKHVKSNAIVLAKNLQLIGVGAGQMNRVQSVRLSIGQAGNRAPGSVMASDAFFPFADSIEEAAAAGVKAIIQPGGSKRDDEVIVACDRLGLAMVFTGVRHFRH